jgi:hypothetical protein
MGILQHDKRQSSELQSRISSELREKAQRTSLEQDDVDLAEDSEYVKHLQKTSRFGWFWFVLILLAVISVIIILII